MSRGVLLFAYDTATVRYTDLAVGCARRIQQHLQLPVTLVTDAHSTVSEGVFDSVVITTTPEDQQQNRAGKTASWKNRGRCHAYELSPYEQTLVIDTDYAINSNRLLALFERQQPYAYYTHRRNLGETDRSPVDSFGLHYAMCWATVVYFSRNAQAEALFSVWKMIEANYEHYANIYGFRTQPFRNDFALTIAAQIVNGHSADHSEYSIKGELFNVTESVQVQQQGDSTELIWADEKSARFNRIRLTETDLHFLSKTTAEQIYDR